MNSIATLSAPVAAPVTALETFNTVVSALTTTDKKGNVRGFMMSIAYASKDERGRLTSELYAKQCLHGDYGMLMRDVLAEGIVPKGQREVIELMLGASRRPSKATARNFCAIIEGLHDKLVAAGKAPKGKKQALINMVAGMSALIGREDTSADDAARTIG